MNISHLYISPYTVEEVKLEYMCSGDDQHEILSSIDMS